MIFITIIFLSFFLFGCRDVAVAEQKLLMMLEMCPVGPSHQAEALNDDVALSSLENEIQGAAVEGGCVFGNGIWEME